jgi:hypothetical protein
MQHNNSLNENEQYIYNTIRECIDGGIINSEAARRLGKEVRTIQRMKRAVEDFGVDGILHGLKDKRSNNRSALSIEKKIITFLKKKDHHDFGPTFAQEKLEEILGITKSRETIRLLMSREQLWKVKKERRKETHRAWREPMAKQGELVQYDGGYHDWNEDGEEECVLLAIDDATSEIKELVFEDNEGVVATFRFWWSYFERWGLPVAIYLDKFGTYKVNHKHAVDNHEFMTQFERAMKECDVRVITAHSPQAKGRVERSFDTHQDRLIKELRLAKKKTRSEMDEFARTIYIPKHNKKFARLARDTRNAHRPLSDKLHAKLPSIFSKQHKRKVNNDFTVQWNNRWFQIPDKQPVSVYKKDTVIIEERLDGTIHIRLDGKYLHYIELPRRPKAERTKVLIRERVNLLHKPSVNHPWRRHFTK